MHLVKSAASVCAFLLVSGTAYAAADSELSEGPLTTPLVVSAGAPGPVGAPLLQTDLPPVRVGVIATNNQGISGETPLKYADAEGLRVERLLLDVGGFHPADLFRVPGASPDDLAAALSRAVIRADEIRRSGRPVVFFFYYTGHAGLDGLHLSGETMSLDELKGSARVVPAVQRIFAIDACSSGQFFRSKGSRMVELSDGPGIFLPPENEAWITSSGPEEESFEVDKRRGALFTHYFVSGARGAADSNGDRLVTLAELFSFVSHQTATSAAEYGRVQSPRWAGTLQQFVIGDLEALGSGLDVVGPVREALLVIDKKSERVAAEMPVGPGGLLMLAPGVYQVVASRQEERPLLAEVTVRADRVQRIEVEQRLRPATGVRTMGGLLVRHPWSIGVGYRLGLGALPNHLDSHGGWLRGERLFNRGNRLALLASAEGGARDIDHKDFRISAGLEWGRDLTRRGLRFTPGLRAEGVWVNYRGPLPDTGDSVDPDQGDGSGDASNNSPNENANQRAWDNLARRQQEQLQQQQAQHGGDIVLNYGLADIKGLATFGFPLADRVELSLAFGGGVQLSFADRVYLLPIASAELGFQFKL